MAEARRCPDGTPEELESLQEFILRRLETLQMTQISLAEAIGVDAPAVNNWLRGRVIYSTKWISKRAAAIAAFMRCEESEIIRRSEIQFRSKRVSAVERDILNTDILKALSEEASPTSDMLEMLYRIQEIVGANLPYPICKELLRLSGLESRLERSQTGNFSN